MTLQLPSFNRPVCSFPDHPTYSPWSVIVQWTSLGHTQITLVSGCGGGRPDQRLSELASECVPNIEFPVKAIASKVAIIQSPLDDDDDTTMMASCGLAQVTLLMSSAHETCSYKFYLFTYRIYGRREGSPI